MKTKFLLEKMKVGCTSEATHYRIQHYVHPAVQRQWSHVQEGLIEEWKKKKEDAALEKKDFELIVAGKFPMTFLKNDL